MDEITRLGYKANDPAEFHGTCRHPTMAEVLVEIKGIRVPSPAFRIVAPAFQEFAALSGLLQMQRLEKRFAVLE